MWKGWMRTNAAFKFDSNNSITMDTIFWDMDGVLIDSLKLDLCVVNPMLEARFGEGVCVSREFILDRFAAHKAPGVFGKGAEFFLNFKEAVGVVDRRHDLGAIADNAGIVDQTLQVFRVKFGDFDRMKFGKGFAEIFALA